MEVCIIKTFNLLFLNANEMIRTPPRNNWRNFVEGGIAALLGGRMKGGGGTAREQCFKLLHT